MKNEACATRRSWSGRLGWLLGLWVEMEELCPASRLGWCELGHEHDHQAAPGFLKKQASSGTIDPVMPVILSTNHHVYCPWESKERNTYHVQSKRKEK